VSIGGKTFYEIIDRENPDNNILKSDYGYISMIDETHMLILFLSTPNPTKNTLESIQKSIKTFLENISFPAKTIFPNVENIVIPQSDIELIVRKNSSISYNSSEYQGILSYHIKDQKDFVMVRDYL